MLHLTLEFGLTILICQFYPCETYGQEQADTNGMIKFSGQIRVRAEADNRGLRSSTGYDQFTFLRTRFGALVTPAKNYSGFIQIQDSRVFGMEKTPTHDSKNVDMHQAYIHARHFIWNRMDIKLGRMEISYGEERLLGRSNWGNTGRSLDGALFIFSLADYLKLDAFAYRLNENSPPPTAADTVNVPDKEDRDFTGFYMTYSRSEKLNADVYMIGDFDHTRNDFTGRKDSLNRVTFGVFLRGRNGNFSWKTEVAGQAGNNNGNTISAYLMTGSAGYTFSHIKWKPAVSAGCDYVSGDDNPTDKKIKTFNTLFASSRFYGGMDYFTDMFRHTGQLGLQDNMVKIRINPLDKISAGLDYHYFLSAKKDKTLNSRAFGQEFDFTASYGLNKNMTFEAGFSVMFPGKLLKRRFGDYGSAGTWGYLTTLFEF